MKTETPAFATLQKKERFEKLYFETRPLLFHYIRKFVRTGQQAIEDVVQECYMRLWENMDKLREEDIMPLLRTYAINYCINQLKKEAKEQQREKIFYDQRRWVADTTDELNFKFTLSEFNEAVESLTPQRRLIYRLIREKGLSYQEISAQLGISTKTIERHINEAMRTLRARFPADKLAGILLLIELQSRIHF